MRTWTLDVEVDDTDVLELRSASDEGIERADGAAAAHCT